MPTLTQAQKDERKENLKSFLSPEALKGYSEAAIGIGTSIADTVQGQKIKRAEAAAAIENIKGGGSANPNFVQDKTNATQKQDNTPPPPSDLILGMSKPIFFGGVGVLVLVAGVGIFLATRSSSAPAAQGK